MKAKNVLAVMIGISLFATSVTAQEAKTIVARKPTLPTASAKSAAAPRVSPLSVTVRLGDATQIRGALMETSSIDMKTSFGSATFPLSEVAGIRMADGNTAMTTVVLNNGDSVTGATDLQRLIVETTWGSATIKGENVTDVLFTPGLKWSSESGLNGVRWTLVAASTPAPKKPKNQVQASSATSTPRRVVTPGQPVYSGQPVYNSQPRVIRTR